LTLLQRVQEALPSTSLQGVFGGLIQVVEEGFRVEDECERAEGELTAKEGELRLCIKKEVQGLLSAKVVNLRKEVDKQRQQLRELQERRERVMREKQEME